MQRYYSMPRCPLRFGQRQLLTRCCVCCAAQFGDAAYCREFVQSAVSRGATYIDVAPEYTPAAIPTTSCPPGGAGALRQIACVCRYGDGVSQARLGPALEGARDKVFLACKTMFRDAEGAAKDLASKSTRNPQHYLIDHSAFLRDCLYKTIRLQSRLRR